MPARTATSVRGLASMSSASRVARPLLLSRLQTAPLRRGQTRALATGDSLRRTPLYDLHQRHGAKTGPFAGFDMPLSYAKHGHAAEHKACRTAAALFDVSHMVQWTLSGKNASRFLARLTPASVSSLGSADKSPQARFASTLSVLLNENGGILDDLMITRQGEDAFYLVTNAGRREEDTAWMRKQLERWNGENGDAVELNEITDHALVALQGPKAAEVLEPMLPSDFDLPSLLFGQSANTTLDGVRVHVARGGYTGNDGFEISVPSDAAEKLTDKLLADTRVTPAGLAARDSLRLEAGLCLYGHDLDETTSPIEAALAWTIGKDRRSPDDAVAFIGKSTVLQQLADGPKRRRVGLIVDGAPAREGARILDAAGERQIGTITSGIPSPTLGANIAMGYVESGSHKRGTAVKVEVRKKLRDARIEKMPFVETTYWRGPK